MTEWMSATCGKLAAALAKAQGDFKAISRTREVKAGPYSFTYAPLDEVLDATREALVGNGLAVTQLLSGDTLRTALIHSSGEWVASSISIAPIPAKVQELGSRLTYLRRYAIAAVLGVAPEEDDDGGPADNPDYRTQPRQWKPPATKAPPRRKADMPVEEDPSEAQPVNMEPGEPPTPPPDDDGMPTELRRILRLIDAAPSIKDLMGLGAEIASMTIEPSLLADARKAYATKLDELRKDTK